MLDGTGNFIDENNGILLIHYDEKCFWGLILRDYAKYCEDIGIDKYDFNTFHWIHINKVMGIGFFAAHFYDTLENGCVVENFPFIRAQRIKEAT